LSYENPFFGSPEAKYRSEPSAIPSMAKSGVSKTAEVVLHLITTVFLILGGVSATIYLEDIWANDKWKIRTGDPIDQVGINGAYLVNIVLLMTAVGCYGMAVIEVLMCIDATARVVEPMKDGFMRPAIYFILGILVMGCAATLGIVGAACILLASLLWGFLAVMSKC
jgi:hypothetical protein